ncbi:hypothetical protein BJX99DRAFT_12255 [Aspergillus californicus]
MSNSEIYPLGRDKAESSRLNDQHKLIMDIVGGPIDKTVPLDNVSSVADVATGTGVWLWDAQRVLNAHSAQDRYYHGFDISDAQFPSTHGIELSVQDVLKPFPSEHHNRYDLVHVRLLVAAITQSQTEAAVSNLMTILKPGGYLQWIEVDFTGLEEGIAQHPKPAPALRAWSKFVDQNNISRCAPGTLSIAFEKLGFLNTTNRSSFVRGREELKARAQAWILQFYATVLPLVLLKTGEAPPEQVGQRTAEILRGLEEYSAEGGLLDVRFGTVVGRKPL